MNKRIKSIWDQAAKTHSGDSWEELTAFMEAYAQLVAADCIATIQLHMPRNGVSSPENVISKRHINNIADAYGISLPLDKIVYDRIMAGADQMAGDGGYSEASLKTPQFLETQAKYEALYGKNPITAADVRHLREMTDCTMMDCKKALTACNGEMDQAVEYLRKGRNYRSSV